MKSDGCCGCNVWRVCLCIYISIIVSALILIWYIGWQNVASHVFDTAEESSSESKLLVGFVLYLMLVFVGTFWLPLPSFFMILLGFFCGFWMGWCFTFAGELTTLAISVSLVRFVDCMREAVESMPKLRQATAILAEEDAKFLILFRFITLPLCVKNYSLGLVDRPIWRLMLLSAPGAAYWSGIIVYLGTKAPQAVKHLRKGETNFIWDLFSGWEIAVIAISICAAVGMAAFAWYEYNKRVKGLTDPLLREDGSANSNN